MTSSLVTAAGPVGGANTHQAAGGPGQEPCVWLSTSQPPQAPDQARRRGPYIIEVHPALGVSLRAVPDFTRCRWNRGVEPFDGRVAVVILAGPIQCRRPPDGPVTAQSARPSGVRSCPSFASRSPQQAPERIHR